MNRHHEYIIIIPARYGSSRFPGKPLAKIGDEEMIVRVCRIASGSGIRTVVATDDDRIRNCVAEAGYEAVMTSTDHKSGTDRVYEAFCLLGKPADIVINLQGDEPFVSMEQLKDLTECFGRDGDIGIATLCREFDKSKGFEALFDNNVVKVTRSFTGEALYFSRSIIPYIRSEKWQEWLNVHTFLTHVGIYAFRAEVLERITSIPRSPLEIAENLEQLRWLEHGFRIHVGLTSLPSIGIDTPADLEAANEMLKR